MLLSVSFAAEMGVLASPGLCLMEVMPHVVTMVSGVSAMKAILRVVESFFVWCSDICLILFSRDSLGLGGTQKWH